MFVQFPLSRACGLRVLSAWSWWPHDMQDLSFPRLGIKPTSPAGRWIRPLAHQGSPAGWDLNGPFSLGVLMDPVGHQRLEALVSLPLLARSTPAASWNLVKANKSCPWCMLWVIRSEDPFFSFMLWGHRNHHSEETGGEGSEAAPDLSSDLASATS